MPNPNPKSGFDVNPQNINRNGRPPKGYSITEWFREMLSSNPEVKEELGNAILEKARKGDVAAQKLVWNYIDGMPQQKVDVTTLGKEINTDSKKVADSLQELLNDTKADTSSKTDN